MQRAEPTFPPRRPPSANAVTAGTCSHCGREAYSLQAIDEMRVCGRSDCLRVALAAGGLLSDAV